MKTFFFILLVSILCLGNATAFSPASVGTNAPAVFHFSLEAKPSETRFLKKIAEKILQKRIQKAAKAVGRKYGEEGKWMAIIGLSW